MLVRPVLMPRATQLRSVVERRHVLVRSGVGDRLHPSPVRPRPSSLSGETSARENTESIENMFSEYELVVSHETLKQPICII